MSENEVPVLQVRVFPESGHHYAFAALSRGLLAAQPTLRTLCEQERVAWRELDQPWLRGRFGMNEGIHGMWICFESNLGDITRGSVYEPQRSYHPQEAAEHDSSNPSPYAAISPTRLPDGVESIPIMIELGGKDLKIAELEIVWQQPMGIDRDVDLVVDFGNTRTVVLAIEHNQSMAGKLSTLCHNIRFSRRGAEYAKHSDPKLEDSCAIADSWFILHEPVFAGFDPPSDGFTGTTEIFKTETLLVEGLLRKQRSELHYSGIKRVPQMFVELSPVVMGDSARETLSNLDLSEGGNYTLSSPKRYVWDTDSLDVSGRTWWCMFPNRYSSHSRLASRLPGLKGSMLRFLPLDRREWTIDNPPNEDADLARRPTATPAAAVYPRGDAMIWAALGIIELAYRQITSEQWRAGNDPFIARTLRRVLVTYPSGWTTQETEAYRVKWQKAIDIFTLGHLRNRRSKEDGGDRPQLIMDLDEARASQLPIIYSEIIALGNQGENWIELLGHGSGTDAKVRVMTVDIGGGTSDISIIEYRDALSGNGVDLEAKLLFRDSSTTAGDTLAKEVIESVLLPALGSRFHGNDEQMTAFENILRAPPKGVAEIAKWSRIVKLVFLPVIRQWLKDLSEGRVASADGTRWSPDRIMGAESRLVDAGALEEFNSICRVVLDVDVMPDEEPIFHDTERLHQCVDEVFRPLVQSLAKYVSAFGVDMITLSGKPSELPQVKKLLENNLPILPQRIIQAKNYAAGMWYPMSSNGLIGDAKTVTAVGAALYQAIQCGLISGWNIKRLDEDAASHAFPYYWGKMPNENTPWKFDPLYLDPYITNEAVGDSLPGKDSVTTVMQVGTRIGRKILPSTAKPEQVYRLRWNDRAKAMAAGFSANESVILTIERATDPTALKRLVNYQARDGRSLKKAGGLELQPCSLEEEEFWVDSGRFDIAWPENF
jgi:hypothetical protein